MNPFTSKHMTMAKSKGASAIKKCSPLKKVAPPRVVPKAAQDSTKIELTKRYTEGVDRLKANRKAQAGRTDINVNQTTGVASAKPYEKKYVKGKPGSYDRIVDGSNKVVGQAKVPVKGRPGSNEALYRQYKKDSTENQMQRHRTADFYNLTAGKKKTMTEADKKTLMGLGKAVKVK